MAKKLAPWFKGFLTAYAIRAVIDAPMKSEWYADKTEFITDSIYSLLGYYDFVFLLLWVVCALFFVFLSEKNKKTDIPLTVLSVVFACVLPAAQAMRDGHSLSVLFGSLVNLTKTILSVVGFFFFFKEGLGYLTLLIQKKNFLTKENNFYSKKPFLKSFIILESVYLLAVIFNFPGNLCYDTEGQILQVLGQMQWSTHHPLVSTLIIGLPVKYGMILTGSETIGIFIYMLLQITMLSAALSATVFVLAKRKLSSCWLTFVIFLYSFAPVYSNIASTAIKDVPFISALVGYFVCLVLLTEDRELFRNGKFMVVFVLLQMMTCLLRKNGFYVVILGGLIWCVSNIRAYGFKQFIKNVLGVFLIGAAAAMLVNTILAGALHANKGSMGEALSLPFQVTARYINYHYDELTDREIEAISAVLGDDMANIADRYNPYLSDPVKALYKKSAGTKELVNYLGVWTTMFFKHPGVYVDAFFEHTYGWYSPNITTATRYETEDDDFYIPEGIPAVLDKVMIFVYRFADRISLLGVVQNAGFYVWSFWYLTYLQKKNVLKQAGAVLWVSLLVCFIAPGFMEHTRYAFPIVMTMPFFFFFTVSQTKQENNVESR